ncbi:hypothetical protein [Paraburkholderia sediminicola]|uniref:hypothetical protein n=1 Tax=Paraburkholderia sediminicola TaxID=458836 RepID=UPI0038B7F28D
MEFAELVALFEQWASAEGLPLDRSALPGKTYVWMQTEQAWFGFEGLASVLERSKV